jgi:hypothetical protein
MVNTCHIKVYNLGTQMLYKSLYIMFKTISKSAGILKIVFKHLFILRLLIQAAYFLVSPSPPSSE